MQNDRLESRFEARSAAHKELQSLAALGSAGETSLSTGHQLRFGMVFLLSASFGHGRTKALFTIANATFEGRKGL